MRGGQDEVVAWWSIPCGFSSLQKQVNAVFIIKVAKKVKTGVTRLIKDGLINARAL